MRTHFTLVFTLHALWGMGQSSTGTEHWVAFMENLDLQFNMPPSFHLVVSSEPGANGQVEFPATGFAIPFSVAAGTDVVIDLPTNNYYAAGDEAIFDFGLRVTSDAPVNVQAYHDRQYFSEATLVLPTTMLGSHYRVLAHEDASGISPAQFVVLATADDTEVEITPGALTASFRPPGVPFTVMLDAGQTVQIQAYADLSGTEVRALDPQKALAVFAGARQARVGCSGGAADDQLYNQIFPTARWGRDFIVVPYLGRNGDEVRVLAAEDGTEVTVDGTVYTLDAGQVASFHASVPLRILANAQVAVGQFNESQTCNNGATGDPAYLFVPPLDFTDQRCLWHARDADGTPEHYVNIHTASGSAPGQVYLDGVDISAYFLPVPDVSGHWYLQRAIGPGSHELVAEKRFQAVAYSFGDYNSYTHALGFENNSTTSIPERQLPVTAAVARGTDWLPAWTGTSEQVRILDLRGRLLIDSTWRPGTTLPTGNLDAGVYLYERIAQGARIGAGRLVVR